MTLAFSWATNALYSTGPDAGSATRVDPASTANGFISGTVIAPQHVNFLLDAIGDQIIQAVDGVGGGTYTLGAALRFQGADVEINAGLEILAAGELNVQSGGLINVLSGGLIDIASGGQVEISSGAVVTVVSGGLIDVISGGTVEFNASADLKIDDALDFFRLTLTPQSVQPDGAGLPSWNPRFTGDVHAGVTAGWQQDDVSAPFSIAFPINLPVGDDILEINVSVNGSSTSGTGGHASKPTGSDLPSVALVQVSAQGTATVLARRADQAADVAAYNVDHVITLANGATDAGTMPRTVDDDFAYYVVVKGETGANAVAGEYAVTAVSGDCVSRSYRSALMVY
jgi:hypothetical protein